MKQKQKHYRDSRHTLSKGDLALLAQKQTKRDSPYDSRPHNYGSGTLQASETERKRQEADDDEFPSEFNRETRQPGNPDESTEDQAAGSNTQDSGCEAQNGDDDNLNVPPSISVPHETPAGSQPTTRSQGLTLAWVRSQNEHIVHITTPHQ